MRSDSPNSLCPSRYCSAYNPVQVLVTERQAELAKEAAIASAARCTACGSVYVSNAMGVNHVLGTLRRAGTRWEWKSRVNI
jgi:hypothetical protein